MGSVIIPFIEEETEALTIPSHSQQGRERKGVQTHMCLPPSHDLSYQVTHLSQTERRHSSAEALTVTHTQNHQCGQEATGHTQAEDAKQTKLVGDRAEQGRAALLGHSLGKRMRTQGLLRGNRTQSTAVSKALSRGPYLLGKRSEANTFRPPTRSSREPGKRGEESQPPRGICDVSLTRAG